MCEITGKRARAAVEVRLEGDHEPPIAEHLTGRLQRRGDLRGVVSVVVHHGDASRFTERLEAPLDAREACKRRHRCSRVLPQRQHDAEGGQSIAHVVPAAQGELELAQRLDAPAHRERCPRRLIGDRFAAQVRVATEAISQSSLARDLQLPTRPGVIDTGDHATVSGDTAGELVEGGFQLGERGVGVEVLGLDGRHHRQLRPER